MKKTVSKLAAIFAVALTALFTLSGCGPKEDPEIAVSGVSLSQTSVTLVVGGTTTLTATVQPSGATNKTVTWSSSNASVATVNSGTITAVSDGTATITATAGGKSATCAVTVNKKVGVVSIELDRTEAVVYVGSTLTLSATVKPDDASDKTVVWTSSDKGIASVEDGKVAGINIGTVTITAKAGDKEVSCSVLVTSEDEESIKASLMKIYDAMDGPNWSIERKWDMSKDLNSWEGVIWGLNNSKELQLYFDGKFALKGEFPDCFDGLTSCTSFRVFNQPGVTGELPESFSKLVNLSSLMLSMTSMTGLPDVFGGMKDLRWVEVYGNQFMTGPLPESLGMIRDGMIAFQVSSNAFTGSIPASWSGLSDVEGFSLVANRLSGKIPDSFLDIEGEELAYRLDKILQQQDGYGFDVTDIDMPGYWPMGTITDIDGKTFTFADVVKKNKYTVYISWADWCPHSSVLMPALKDYYENYRQDGLEIIATIWHPVSSGNAENHGFSEEIRIFEEQFIHDKGYDLWYNFYYAPYYGKTQFTHSVPVAEVYDSEGHVLFSTHYYLNDPIRKRYGAKEYDYTASTDLIPFLETVLGPAEIPDEYASTDYSKNGEVMTLQKASTGKGINIVFMGDAYTDKDMGAGGLYETVMRQAMEELFKIEPYKTFSDRFNVYAVKVVSENGRIGKDYSTALGTVFGDGTDINGDKDKCFEYAAKIPGLHDTSNLLISVIVNTKRNSGTTYMFEEAQSGVAFVSSMGNNPEAFGITLRHESGGHGFGFLADEYSEYGGTPSQSHIDEYTIPYQKYGWFSNVDFTNDPAKVRWSAFLSDDRYKDEVGVFEGGALYSSGAYRPSENSMMRDNYEWFNAPSRWAIYKRIMELSGETPSFERFLDYDAVNRGKKQSSASRTRSIVEWEHSAPPVILP